MDKDKIAEWLLAQAMEPVRASVVIGDLRESGAAHTRRWFWSNVFQTLAATVGRDLREQPSFVLGLAVRGALILCALLLLVLETRGFAFQLASTMLAGSSSVLPPREWLWPAMRIASLLATLYVGRWIALRSLGRDLAVCVAMLLVFPFVEYGFVAVTAWSASLGAHQGYLAPALGRFWYNWRDAGFMAAFLAGVALVRRRRQVPCAA